MEVAASGEEAKRKSVRGRGEGFGDRVVWDAFREESEEGMRAASAKASED